jgi:MYXO-CTERM domain-containing protein
MTLNTVCPVQMVASGVDGTLLVAVAVPAPPSVIPLLTGALGLLGYGWHRRRQAAA